MHFYWCWAFYTKGTELVGPTDLTLTTVLKLHCSGFIYQMSNIITGILKLF